MADVTTQPDGSAQITVNQSDITGLNALAEAHLPALKRAEQWFGADIAPELGEARSFLEGLASNEQSTLTVTAPQIQALRGMLQAHLPDFSQVLAVVESPAVRSMLSLAKALL